MKALITGITGFVGSHMAEYLLNNNIEVYGTIRHRSRMNHISHLVDDLNLVECELRDPFSVESVIGHVKPDLIFHLAAQSFVPTSWNSPMDTIHNNVAGQLNIFEAVRRLGLNSKIQIACSSEEYGHVEPSEVPIKETNPLRPLSPYAISKVTQDYLGYQYYKSYGLHVVRTRTFNHTGPRRGENFVTSNFSKQIAEIEKGIKPPVIHVGNLQAKRDFTDVRDIVRGYWLALEKGDPGDDYNIASNTCWTIEEMLNLLLSYSKVEVQVQEDPARLRPSDVEILLGDYSKFHQKTGWKPEIPFEQTMLDLLNYWRDRV
ncbi:GDP-mannose 4,6-dehydratase [Paenibacillus mucilaginosus]|uniref:GDP-mannose 4,6-dehydratase n=2 Tax=Paenibacillus mucilaginosus TaxID=61624 RepID=I0BJU0_9BACL|nr:GDP-mannose 4,6-dehydratase [Paenibacillus mucilaginosus]AEI41873.1 NAD-dependent epimerase/dehydratase [Paenibacillus mucilaginosus KNP414]AFH62637.1 NAD-dependent epimerase [Paenibacillus mucilaginosus K02]MCG7214547.1 GDP-mannose 4,6-dehydratase [Paenibacillus mucilaginosus]WDM30827.1 GDP-mannose 4,6-dehydratase [Paenibacillus mucilaginosus]WFA18999.1 SDR family oxidoreductase [Paenibacillus mucilaginosus]